MNKNECPRCKSTSVVVKRYPRGKKWLRCTTTMTTDGCGFGWSEYK